MSFSLAGKQFIITGASRGIGAEIASAAAANGAKALVLGYQSNRESVDKVISKLQSDKATSSTAVHAVQGNLVDQKSCSQFIEAAVSKLEGGKVDGLILSAGVMNMVSLADSNDENLARHFDTNVKGTLFTIQAALPHIVNDGRIVTFSTSVTVSPQALGPGYLQYTMCKAAIEQMVRVLQRDPTVGGPDRRIGINCVAPGATATDLFLNGKSDELIKKIGSLMPEGRIGQPDEVAQAVLFLLTPASNWVKGQLLRINGAQTL